MILNYEHLKLYKALDLQKPIIPQRSTLYQLEPLGIGTPLSESLTSYISRLADAHCVYFGELCLNLIQPLLRKNINTGSRTRSIDSLFGSRTITRAINGRGRTASTMVDAIKKLTLGNELHLLTLLNWSNSLSDKGLLRPTKAWCPLCFESWHREEKIIYEPLIWSLAEVKLCPTHNIPLQNLCPYCSHPSKILGWKAKLGHCIKCQKWLGNRLDFIVSDAQSDDELDLNIWIAQNVGEVISYMPSMSCPASRDGITHSMCRCIELLGGIGSFAKAFEKDYPRVASWQSGKNIPKLNSTLNLCYSLNIPLISFFNGEIAEVSLSESILKKISYKTSDKTKKSKYIAGKRIPQEDIHQALLKALEEYPPVRAIEVLQRLGLKSYLVLDKYFPEIRKELSKRYAEYTKQERHRELKYRLESIITANEEPPPSLQEVCRRVCVNNTTLYIHFPDLCDVITTRYKNHLSLKKSERADKICQKIRQIAIELHENGIRPTSSKVGELLDKPGLLRERCAVDALFKVQRELGYRS